MKPLTNTKDFLKRLDNFKNGELRSFEVISPSVMSITLAGQDEARAFDWISVTLEFSNITDARVVDDKRLSLIDMGDGVSIINNNEELAFGIGECYNIDNIKNSTSFIVCKNIKYEEGLF
ncbi:MAG: hypothetical protein DRG78_17390 [Epsilonproteobacteria bacterium]|nr:MAG: hypothetical protein DRG78_17390 [Campylobacterota bacterium]